MYHKCTINYALEGNKHLELKTKNLDVLAETKSMQVVDPCKLRNGESKRVRHFFFFFFKKKSSSFPSIAFLPQCCFACISFPFYY